jgi:phosphatidylserine synthase 2
MSEPERDVAFEQWIHVSPKFKWIYTPHRIFLSLAFILFVVFVHPQSPLLRLIVFWTISTVIIAACLQDGPLIRPHPFFWRCVLGLSLIQTATILGLTLIDHNTVREAFVILTPRSAGNYMVDRDYSMGCEIYDRSHPEDPFHHVRSIVFDEFVVAHVIGWIVHSVLIRDVWICWIISIAFELFERALKPWFPNFNECWWDSVIVDIILSNGLGIYIGMKLVKAFTLRSWETRLIRECESGNDWIARALKQFTPRSYQRFDWRPFESLRRYYIVLQSSSSSICSN